MSLGRTMIQTQKVHASATWDDDMNLVCLSLLPTAGDEVIP